MAAFPYLHWLRLAGPIAAVPLTLGAAGCGSIRSTTRPASTASDAVSSPYDATARVPLRDVQAAQFRVCAFAFHSPHELAAIKSQLSPKDFEFIELTPAHVFGDKSVESMPRISSAASDPLAEDTPGWLMNRCRPDLRCDIVVYSGEFAGGFFGNYGVSLNVQEIEEASCQSPCQGLFHDPREVFLLACNTLATKNADNRTPREYLHVLLAHGFSRADAERVVDLRYGPLGPSFRESLRRSFMGVPRIYGFSSVAPRGEITAALLQQYFERKGDYARYLTRAERDSKPNKELFESFAGTSLVQTTGLTPLETAAADRALVCRLYDDTQTVVERLRIVQQLFARRDFLSFVPTLEVFLSRHTPEKLCGEERRLFVEIQLLEAPRRQMIELMYSLNVSALKMQMAHLALQLGWIGTDEFRRLAVEGAKQLLAEPLSSEVVDIACELIRYVPAGAGLRSEEIPEEFFWHSEGFRLLDCLSPADARLSARMLAGLESIDESTRLWAAYALSRRLPLDDAVLKALARRLNDPSAGVRDRLQWIFGAQLPLSADVLAAIRERDPALAKTLAARQQEGK